MRAVADRTLLTVTVTLDLARALDLTLTLTLAWTLNLALDRRGRNRLIRSGLRTGRLLAGQRDEWRSRLRRLRRLGRHRGCGLRCYLWLALHGTVRHGLRRGVRRSLRVRGLRRLRRSLRRLGRLRRLRLRRHRRVRAAGLLVPVRRRVDRSGPVLVLGAVAEPVLAAHCRHRHPPDPPLAQL